MRPVGRRCNKRRGRTFANDNRSSAISLPVSLGGVRLHFTMFAAVNGKCARCIPANNGGLTFTTHCSDSRLNCFAINAYIISLSTVYLCSRKAVLLTTFTVLDTTKDSLLELHETRFVSYSATRKDRRLANDRSYTHSALGCHQHQLPPPHALMRLRSKVIWSVECFEGHATNRPTKQPTARKATKPTNASKTLIQVISTKNVPHSEVQDGMNTGV